MIKGILLNNIWVKRTLLDSQRVYKLCVQTAFTVCKSNKSVVLCIGFGWDLIKAIPMERPNSQYSVSLSKLVPNEKLNPIKRKLLNILLLNMHTTYYIHELEWRFILSSWNIRNFLVSINSQWTALLRIHFIPARYLNFLIQCQRRLLHTHTMYTNCVYNLTLYTFRLTIWVV